VKDQASLRQLCDAVLNGAVSLDAIEAMLLEQAVDRARGNLSSAARMLGMTRPRLAYRLKRRQEEAEDVPLAEEVPPAEEPAPPAAPAAVAAKTSEPVLA
jgi:Bacterial regulatory protein, Fis family